MTRKMAFRHPGLIFRDNVIKDRGLSVTVAAEMLKVTRPALSNVLNGHADISPEMALRISTVFGGTPEIWMNLQIAFDLDQARPKIESLGLKHYTA